MAHSPDRRRRRLLCRARRPRPRRRRRRPRASTWPPSRARPRPTRSTPIDRWPTTRCRLVRGALARRRGRVRGPRRAGGRRRRPDVDRDRRHHRRHPRPDVRQASGVVPRGRGAARRLVARRRRRGDDRAADGEAGRRPTSSAARGAAALVGERIDLRDGRPGTARRAPVVGDRPRARVRPGWPSSSYRARWRWPSSRPSSSRGSGVAHVFDDEYISSGGQLHELHRPVATASSPTSARSSTPEALACHPYDVCTAMLLEEAGGVVTDPWGAPLDVPLDTTSPVAWVGYANPALAACDRPRARRARPMTSSR